MPHVYFNLNRGCYSIRDPKTGRLERKDETTRFLVLRDVTFRVRERGRLRAVREGSRNVHAYVTGEVGGDWTAARGLVAVCYNPFRDSRFVRRDTGEAVEAAKVLVLTTRVVDGKRFPVMLAEL